jgi:hypothetical protein
VLILRIITMWLLSKNLIKTMRKTSYPHLLLFVLRRL